MVYTVLIVDDEFLIRKGMRQFLDWEQYGFTIIGEVANGLEALKFTVSLNMQEKPLSGKCSAICSNRLRKKH